MFASVKLLWGKYYAEPMFGSLYWNNLIFVCHHRPVGQFFLYFAQLYSVWFKQFLIKLECYKTFNLETFNHHWIPNLIFHMQSWSSVDQKQIQMYDQWSSSCQFEDSPEKWTMKKNTAQYWLKWTPALAAAWLMRTSEVYFICKFNLH